MLHVEISIQHEHHPAAISRTSCLQLPLTHYLSSLFLSPNRLFCSFAHTVISAQSVLKIVPRVQSAHSTCVLVLFMPGTQSLLVTLHMQQNTAQLLTCYPGDGQRPLAAALLVNPSPTVVPFLPPPF